MNLTDILIIIINFAGSIGVFLFGMKLMSEGLQKFAGRGMRHIMGKITGNPLSGILVGALLTVMVQSSSASTVMVVSFVNAGMMSLAGAISVIMGANIGSTLITWILKIFALGESGGNFSLPLFLLAIAIFFMFAKRERLKYIGEFTIGFALLLLGMEYLQSSVPNLEEYPNFLAALGSISDHGFISVLLFTLIGIVLTCMVQASAAMMAIALAMCYKGWIGFEVAMALVMGLNIGTTITANIAAMVANNVGKKSARAHLVFNVIGTILTLIAFRPVMILVDSVTTAATGVSPYTKPGSPMYDPQTLPWALCFFHTFFNVVNTLILVWFIPQIIRIVDWMVKPAEEDAEDEFRLTYIGGTFMNTAELNIQSAKQEIENFSHRVLRMYGFLPGLRTAHLDAIKSGKYDYSIGTAYSGLYALYEKLGDYVINVSEAIDVDNSKKVIENQ